MFDSFNQRKDIKLQNTPPRRSNASEMAATQLRGYAATQLRGYAATQLRGYAATRLRGYAATQLHGYSTNYTRIHANALSPQ